ncbi:MAG: hypothetical protein J2P31_02305 [Blastocatellia bacterium]|nr:hypothetical protein [Blastocatellia bacterium]
MNLTSATRVIPKTERRSLNYARSLKTFACDYTNLPSSSMYGSDCEKVW